MGSPPLSFEELRREGLDLLERLTDRRWTDFNDHDPGITILEQVCYALADLGYRMGHTLPDLLAEGGADPYESLFASDQILTGRPVTREDLRRIVLDVHGVRNAWVEPVTDQGIALHYHRVKQELSAEADPPLTEPVTLRGLHRVLVQAVDPADGDNVRRRVALRLHRNRSLCEDFLEIKMLESQKVEIEARVEIGTMDDPGALVQQVLNQLADQVSQPVRFTHPAHELRAGRSMDSLFEGPPLEQGFLSSEMLERSSPKTTLNASDLIRSISDVPGVRAVASLRMASGGRCEDWRLPLDPSRAPILDPNRCNIRLQRDGLPVFVDRERVTAGYSRLQTRDGGYPRLPAPPSGRDRRVARYRSVQHQLPATYGVGEMGLAKSASPLRQAQARRLKAYLTFFDQLLADSYAQLAGLKDLLSTCSPNLGTRFTQDLGDPSLDLADIRLDRSEEMPENGDPEPSTLPHRHRLLNHLLARFGESMDSFLPPRAGEIDSSERFARHKQTFLHRYPHLSGGRGTGFDYLQSPPRPACLEDRLRLSLGLRDADGEDLVLLEHILLRPLAEDHPRTVPLLGDLASSDPYSLQLTFVFPSFPERFQSSANRRWVEQLVREHTPAHLMPHIRWLPRGAWSTFLVAHQEWLDQRRADTLQQLGLSIADLSSEGHDG